jgi:hypothetical protein
MEYVRVAGLSRLDGLDLGQRFPDASITFEDAVLEDPQHGELASVAVVAISVAGLQALAAWLLKNRRAHHIEHTVEVVAADGSRRTEKLVMDLSESTTDGDVAKELGRLTHFFGSGAFENRPL